MWRWVARAVIVCAIALLGVQSALASDRIIVLRGAHCPNGMASVLPDDALRGAATACVLVDPVTRARFGGATTIAAPACGARAAEIASLGATLCRLHRDEVPRATNDGFRPVIRRNLPLFRLLAFWAQWAIMATSFLRPDLSERPVLWRAKGGWRILIGGILSANLVILLAFSGMLVWRYSRSI